jgi:hypothetical protein
MFGANPIPPESLLATIALTLAGVQVLLALWIYRKLPLAPSPPRPVPIAHRVTGFALVALTRCSPSASEGSPGRFGATQDRPQGQGVGSGAARMP